MRMFLLLMLGCASRTPAPVTDAPAPEAPRFAGLRVDPSRTVPLDPGAGPCMDVVLHDLDGDDDLDVVLSLEGPPNAVLENDGTGQLLAVATPQFKEPTDTEQAAVADFNGDGCADIYFANEEIDHVDEVYFGDCALAFVEGAPGPDGITPLPANSVVHGDLEPDGITDVVVGHRGQTAWWQRSDEGWEDATTALPIDDATTQDLALADLDDDGDLDVILANEGPNAVWRNDGDHFVDVSQGLAANQRETRAVAVLDADQDGHLDLVFGNVGWGGLPSQSQLLLGDGGFEFENATRFLPDEDRNTTDLEAVDLDGDGDLDLLTANTTHVPGQLLAGPWTAWRNDEGRFTDVTPQWMPDLPTGFAISIAVGDLDGDDALDAYLCARGGPDLLLFGATTP